MAKDRDKKTFLIEPHSPYYLHPSEGPGVLITAEVFDGKNYELWENAVRIALKANNKLGFIDGTLERPEVREGDFTEYHAWDIVNSMVCSWLLNVIDRKLRPSVAYAGTARAMWEDLQKRYGVASAPKIYQLKTSISECKQGGLEVVKFYSKLRGLWSELSNHVRITHCTCKGCKCDISTKIVKMFEEEKSYQFLMGLNDDLSSHTRSQILASEPLPPLEKFFNIVS